MNYKDKRELQKHYNMQMGFDYLPQNYEFMSRHSQNNAYQVAMWFNEENHLDEAISELEKEIWK
jgi:hypothetical protein